MANGHGESDLKRSFKLGLHGLLTTCSKEEFCKAFPGFTIAEKERLHHLYIQVIVSLHKNIEDEFEALCEETKVDDILGSVEELVEEQTLDPLYLDKTNLNTVAQALSTLKKNEIRNLTTMLEKSEAHNNLLRSRVELLQKEIHNSSDASNAVDKKWQDGQAKPDGLGNVKDRKECGITEQAGAYRVILNG